ncbi:MAG: cytochrome b N-terminal domain-containing protein [Nitrospinae bacterium]|nr:cytochrome b N-terminal domain-containing protein [Nitrospinota bacterium]
MEGKLKDPAGPLPGARAGGERKQQIPMILRPGNALLVFVQETLNKVFTPSLNPLYLLGGITFLFFWILIATGLYLFLFYKISATNAYESVQYITENQRYYGGIIRSLHRYAADGLLIVIAIHILQVFFSDRFRKNRWVAWVSGAAVLFPAWFDGVTGYFLVWDEKGRMIAQLTAELLDPLPLSAEPLSRNFLTGGSVHFLLFFVITYLHITIPFLIMGLLWLHCMRVARPNILPPKPVGWAIIISLLAVSLVKPALSMAPADLSKILGEVEMDWFYFWPYPLIHKYSIPPLAVWAWGAALFGLFTAMPWIIRSPARKPGAETMAPQGAITVDLEKCVGCALCFQACPFEAVNIVEKLVNGETRAYVTVDTDRCAECGFCVTSCEFDAVAMAGHTKSDFQAAIDKAIGEARRNGEPSVTFICERCCDLSGFTSEKDATLTFHPSSALVITPCIGVISPLMVEHCFTAGASCVAVAGCRALDCHYRETRRRIKDQTVQFPKHFVVEEMKDFRVQVFHVSPYEVDELKKNLTGFFDGSKTGGDK